MLAQTTILQSQLEKYFTNVMDCLTKEEEKELQKFLEELDGLKGGPSEKVMFVELKKDSPSEKAKVDLKILPKHLKHVFFEDNEASPVVISNSLTNQEESRLAEVLKKHKAAIRWHISDLKGISPSYCMHKINMEVEYKPVRQL